MRSRHGFYFSHVRGESSMLLDSIAEAIRIGDEGGVPAQISHVKASGRENWPKLEAALGLIDEARRRGVDVAGDVYPYNAGSTKMDEGSRGLGTAHRLNAPYQAFRARESARATRTRSRAAP